MNKSGRRYCFTSFDVEACQSYSPDDRVKLLVWQIEVCPETGRRHVQGYVELPKSQKPTAVKKLFGDNAMHVEHARGTADQCIEYATKEESREPPDNEHPELQAVMYGQRDGQGKRNDLTSFVAAIRDGASDRLLCEEHPSSMVRYGRAVATVRGAYAEPRSPSQLRDVRVYWGPTGTGKSARAHLQLPAAYSKQPGNRWWDGYTTGQSVIIDDFRDEWFSIDYMLRILDIYPLKVSTFTCGHRSQSPG